ncbi:MULTISPECIES: transcriptional repressor LexA [Shouchella]|uniref:LexA repressor n=3 Tax=Bacillaceae TaxID=186817 RepID=A0A060LU33_9BACI|nr:MULTISPECIES: transcriptional repressor LexA [Bacillaceae]RQW20596.1 transcriptional repressor LexA [Bacillus sp. C1-1]AIC94741.1 LexA repressor [Shouchella lehensis G1]KQL51723.1 XRE family transcriptional regulator [Alkalicoccobacillus plakortidis]MBG9784394.1 XRE family transcriptional regulator [Shouchella lehensis]TES50611.1 transcriptional repressor LexA [Shouchella lehensis]
MSKLSTRQEEILLFIKDEVKKKGYPPSVREIGEAVGLASSSTVHGHLARLEKKGYIRRDPTKPRAIEVLSLEAAADEAVIIREKTRYIPVMGKVTAGSPITAIENVEDYIPLPDHMAGHEQVYALVIQGESMIEAGILDGDQVYVKQTQTADNGDIIVAMTDEHEATVKRFFREKNYIRLQPENSTMDPIILDNCTILGKVIGVFRTIQ